MKNKSFVLVLFLAFLTISCSGRNEFFVSPTGSDSHNGSRAEPFATIGKAVQAVRDSLARGQETDLTVWLSSGVYPLEKPISLTPSDSGKNGFKVLYRALPGETPVISGGLELKGWEKNAGGIWTTLLPALSGAPSPREMFINGKRCIRARTPNEGFLRVKAPGEDKRTNFYFDEGDFPLPENPGSVELVLLHDWSISRIRLDEIDADDKRLTTVDFIGPKALDFFTLDQWEPHPRYFLENSRQFLDADYEWCLDDSDNRIYIKLPESKNPGNSSVVIPLSGSLLTLQGSRVNPVSNIHFEGITFSYCAWEIPEKGYAGIQACSFDPRPESIEWSVIPAAVHTEWAENCYFENCSFSHLGGSGLWIGTGSRHCSVSRSTFTDISGNGLMIGEGRDRKVNGEVWWQSAPEQAATGNSINNCFITECGRQFFGAIGIWCGLTAETTIKENEISSLPYTGISVGWMWDPQPTPCRDNTVVGNHIHHIMQLLSDGGGIYMLGLQPGSELIGNHIHDVRINAGRAESNGMFIDEGSTDLVIANNLIYNIAKSPLRFHKASLNLVRGNFLFCTGDNPAFRYNNTKEENIRKEDNRVFMDSDENYRESLNQLIASWKHP